MDGTVSDFAARNRFDDQSLVDVKGDMGPLRIADRRLRRQRGALHALDDLGHHAAIGLDDHEVASLPLRDMECGRPDGADNGLSAARPG